MNKTDFLAVRVNPRWHDDDPAPIAADAWACLAVDECAASAPGLLVPLEGGRMARVDATFGDVLLALIVSAGGAP